jgi:carboxypeptidase C (cathepsin A)
VYYNYFEAELPDPSKAPLLVLQQGGPGCSPVGIGAFREGVGPFAFAQYDGPAVRNITDTRLVRSPASWTSFANLLFLDTPGPTGFSAAAAGASNGTALDDASSTAATMAALEAFYSKFPGTQKLRLFLAGQGYAGHTVPLLAKAILDLNAKAANASTRIPLQGIAVGNPWVSPVLLVRLRQQYSLQVLQCGAYNARPRGV